MLNLKIKRLSWVILFSLFTIAADAQCAMCRAALQNEDDGNKAEGVNNGIVYLMVFPYLLVGTIGYVIYRSRKNRADK